MLQVSTDVRLGLWSAPDFFKLISCYLEDTLDDYRKYNDSLVDTRVCYREVTRSNEFSGVYIFYFKKNGKFYIGSSRTLAFRTAGHEAMLRKGYHSNKRMQKAYAENDSRCPEPIFIITDGESAARAAEQRLLDLVFNDPYCLNRCRMVDTHRPSTEETCKKLSAAAKKQWADPEFKKRIREINARPENLARRIATAQRLAKDPEYRAKIGAASKEVWKDLAYVEKQKLSGAAVWKEEGFRERHSSAMKSHWDNPEYRSRLKAIREEKGNPKRMPICIFGVRYEHARAAAKALGIGENTVRRRCLSENEFYKDWFFVCK